MPSNPLIIVGKSNFSFSISGIKPIDCSMKFIGVSICLNAFLSKNEMFFFLFYYYYSITQPVHGH